MPKENKPDVAVVTPLILAAGAVLWRPHDVTGTPEIAIIHRPRYDDWSLPKGKVDPGETEPVAAVREIEEETGFRAHLGRRLATVSYPPVEDSIKKVRYWTGAVRRRTVQRQRRGRRSEVAAGSPGDDGVDLSARPQGAAPLPEAARRHPDGDDRSSRHGGK